MCEVDSKVFGLDFDIVNATYLFALKALTSVGAFLC